MFDVDQALFVHKPKTEGDHSYRDGWQEVFSGDEKACRQYVIENQNLSATPSVWPLAPVHFVLTAKQKKAIQCAYADLVGAYQYAIVDGEGGANNGHDWDSHLDTIAELEQCFDFIEKVDVLKEKLPPYDHLIVSRAMLNFFNVIIDKVKKDYPPGSVATYANAVDLVAVADANAFITWCNSPEEVFDAKTFNLFKDAVLAWGTKYIGNTELFLFRDMIVNRLPKKTGDSHGTEEGRRFCNDRSRL